MYYDAIRDLYVATEETVKDSAVFALRRAWFHLDETGVRARGQFGPVDIDTSLAQGLISTAIQRLRLASN